MFLAYTPSTSSCLAMGWPPLAAEIRIQAQYCIWNHSQSAVWTVNTVVTLGKVCCSWKEQIADRLLRLVIACNTADVMSPLVVQGWGWTGTESESTTMMGKRGWRWRHGVVRLAFGSRWVVQSASRRWIRFSMTVPESSTRSWCLIQSSSLTPHTEPSG